MRILSNLMLLGDEAECRDLELLRIVEYISNSESGSEEQVVRILHCPFWCNLLVVLLAAHNAIFALGGGAS
jgi:hypothetical protein